jgi:hypothetical protein
MGGIREILVDAGVNLPLLISGFWGGIVSAFWPPAASLKEVAAKVVTGTATAYYLGPVAIKWTGAPELPTAFLVGLVGFAVVPGITAAARAWRFGGLQQGTPPDGTGPNARP